MIGWLGVSRLLFIDSDLAPVKNNLIVNKKESIYSPLTFNLFPFNPLTFSPLTFNPFPNSTDRLRGRCKI